MEIPWTFWLLSVPGILVLLAVPFGAAKRKVERGAVDAIRRALLGALPSDTERVLVGGTIVARETLTDPLEGLPAVAWRLRVFYPESTTRYSGGERETETRDVSVLDAQGCVEFDLQDASGRAHVTDALRAPQGLVHTRSQSKIEATALPPSVATLCKGKLPRNKKLEVRFQVLRPGDTLHLVGVPTPSEMVASSEGYRATATVSTFRDAPSAPLVLSDEGEDSLRKQLVSAVYAGVRSQISLGLFLVAAGLLLPTIAGPVAQ